MNNAALINFSFQEQSVRIVEKDGEPWFVAKDVAEVLGYVWAKSATIRHVPDEWKSTIQIEGGNSELPPEEWKGANPVRTPGGVQEMLCLSEPGLYFFLARSDKPLALPFQKWIAGEVIPSIRKRGFYAVPGNDRQEQSEWMRNFPYPFLLLEDAAKKMREMRLSIDKGLMTPREWRKVVLGDFGGPAKAEDTEITEFIKKNITITGNEKDFIRIADLYLLYKNHVDIPYSQNSFTRRVINFFPGLTRVQKKIDNYPVLVFKGCKLRIAQEAV